jgi:hypothetical protein
MRVLMLADRSFAARERDMLTRVQVGLIDEGARVVEALPTDLADPDANPLIPTIAYSDQNSLLAARARTRRILRGLQALDPPLAPANDPMALLDVIHGFGEQAWPLAVSVAGITGASLALECASDNALRLVRATEKAVAALERPVNGVWLGPNAPLTQAVLGSGAAWPVLPAVWGTHARDHVSHATGRTAPLSISIVASGEDPSSIAGLLAALAASPHLPADAMMFADAGAFERHPGLWRRARDLRLLERISLIDRMEARRDLILQTDVLAIPEATGQARSIILDAMAGELAILARADPLVEATSVPGVAVLAPSGSSDAWADALTRLLANPDHRATLGKAARAHVVAHRPVHRQIEAIFGAYAMLRTDPGLKFPAR